MNKKTLSAKKNRFIRNLKFTFTNPVTYVFILIALFIIFATKVVYKTETQTESGIATVVDSVWFTLVTIFAGYFDYCVKSIPGRISALILLIFGMLLLSTITGKISSLFMDAKMKRDKGLVRIRRMKGHFVLCGWRNGFDKILESVITSNPEITPDMIVCINDASSELMEQIRDDPRFKGINYVSGDFADEATLKRADIDEAERALIISDHSKNYSQLEMDSRTVLAVLTAKNINPSVYIAAELSDSKFVNHLEMAHCDEIILTSDYEYSLLATASSGMGYSNVIRTLIGDDADSGIIIGDIPKSFVGKTYKEYKTSLGAEKGILIGLLLNTGNFYERRKDALREAQKNPDMKTVVDNLKKIKMLKSNEPLLTPDESYVIPQFTKAIFVKGK